MKEQAGRKNLLALALLLAAGAVLLLLAPRAIRAIELRSFPRQYRETVEWYAEEYELDPMAVYAVIRTESGFDPAAESGVGARGLMQVTEETFAWIKQQIAPAEPLTYEDLWDPHTNIRFGSYYLARCLMRYDGDLSTASAAYHSGWGTVDELLQDPACAGAGQTLRVFPYPQMARYVEKVARAYDKYTELYKIE